MKILERSLEVEFHELNSKESLIQLLNKIYNHHARISDPSLKGKKYFTQRQINFYLHNLTLAVEHDDHKLYKTSEIQKKSGGKRIIHAPSDDFKELLSCIDYLIRQLYNPHQNAYGFIEKKSIVDNARIHLHKNYVYNIDLKDFFHSFDLNRVKLSFFNKPFNLKGELEPLAYFLASLVTCNLNGRRVLPQGSPVSPALTNHICWRLDHRLTGLAKRYGIDYSRYADDITFSSNHNVYYGEFIHELKRIIQLEELEINPKKTRLQKRGTRQEVTGITVNEGLNVSRRFIKQLRMYLYYCEKYGIEKASEIYYKDYRVLRKEGELFDHPGKLEYILKGKLNYLSMVKGKDDTVYTKLANRFNLFFETKTTTIDHIISHWLKFGIDSARKEYYKNLNNNQFKIISEFKLDEDDNIVQQNSLSDEKLFCRTLIQDRPIFSLSFFDLIYGFQFNNDKERELEFDKLVMHSIKRSKNICDFIQNIDASDFNIAIEFLKNKIKKNPFKYYTQLTISSEQALQDIESEFTIYKELSENG